MMSSQSYNQSPFNPPTNQTQSGAPSAMPPTSGQRVSTPPVASNAPNIPGGEGDAEVGAELKDVLKQLSKELKKIGKDFVDALKLYTKDINQERGKLGQGGGAATTNNYSLFTYNRPPPPPRPAPAPNPNDPNQGGGAGKGGGSGFGRGVRSTAMGLGSRMLGTPGGDLQSFLALAPGFARGAEGYAVAEGLGRQAAAGELDAMQASMLFSGSQFGGFGGSRAGIRSALGGGTLLEGFADIGMSRAAAAGLLKGIASSAGATAQGRRIGGFTQRGLVEALAMGADVQGYFSNIGGFQSQLGADARGNFALEFNRDPLARGMQRTALQAQRQSGFMSLYTQNIGADRLSYNQLIDAMGGGSLTRGQAIFQRGAGAAQGAVSGLTSDFSGVGEAMLQADAMRRAGGDRLKALELLEADQAKGGSALYGRLRGMGMTDRTARLTLAGMGLSTRDIQTLTTAGADAAEEFVTDSDLQDPLVATMAAYTEPGTQGISMRDMAGEGIDRMLPMSRMIAQNENQRVNVGLANRGRMQKKLDADLTVSKILIRRSKDLDRNLSTLITTVEGVVQTIDKLNNATRDSFVDSMRAVDDPRTSTLDRIYHYGKMSVIMLLNQKAGI